MKTGKSKVIAALSITVLIFVVGFVLGNISISSKIGVVQNLQNEIYTESLGFDILFDLAEDNLCDESNIADINYYLTDFGEKVAYLEETNKYFEDVRILKNQYNALEIKHFLLINKINTQCGDEYNTILYFYGSESKCNSCLIQGLELTSSKTKHPNIMIYSFDYSSQYAPVKNLINRYGIDTSPTLIINGQKFIKFRDSEEIISLI